jgi:hypothetical protein
VSARAYRDAVAALETERVDRSRAEAEAIKLAEQVRGLEAELKAGSTAEEKLRSLNEASVEADLRHLLSVREAELESVRAELAEQRSRFAAMAHQVPGAERPAEQPAAPSWSVMDEDLISRLARAKQLAGSDD